MDNRAMAAALGLTRDRLIDEQGRMPLDEYLELFEWAAAEFDRPHLGIELANDESEIADFDILLYMTSNASNFEEGVNLVLKYQRLVMEGEIYQFIRHEDAGEIRLSITTAHPHLTAQDVEFSLASIVASAEELTGRKLKPLKTCFRHSKIEPLSDYPAIFGDEVYFDQPENSIWLSTEDLQTSPLKPDPVLLNILKTQADQLLSQIAGEPDFLDHVKFVVSTNLANEAFSAEYLARYLNMTSRTLHRRLKEHGTTFSKLRLEHMQMAARRALRGSSASVSDIAQQLGYADSSSFVRAFKRLQGESPLQYRMRRVS